MTDKRDKGSKPNDLGGKQAGKAGRKRVIGEGMTSPDSTQVPLKAETGEPDMDAIKGRIPPNARDAQTKHRR
jgi:hypothetical protein